MPPFYDALVVHMYESLVVVNVLTFKLVRWYTILVQKSRCICMYLAFRFICANTTHDAFMINYTYAINKWH